MCLKLLHLDIMSRGKISLKMSIKSKKDRSFCNQMATMSWVMSNHMLIIEERNNNTIKFQINSKIFNKIFSFKNHFKNKIQALSLQKTNNLFFNSIKSSKIRLSPLKPILSLANLSKKRNPSSNQSYHLSQPNTIINKQILKFKLFNFKKIFKQRSLSQCLRNLFNLNKSSNKFLKSHKYQMNL